MKPVLCRYPKEKKNGIKPNPQPDQLSGQFFDLITADLWKSENQFSLSLSLNIYMYI
jgi:Fe-S cluster biosynthesis and repair protein YggX